MLTLVLTALNGCVTTQTSVSPSPIYPMVERNAIAETLEMQAYKDTAHLYPKDWDRIWVILNDYETLLEINGI